MPIVFMISTRNAQHFISGPQPGLTGNKLGSEIMNRSWSDEQEWSDEQ